MDITFLGGTETVTGSKFLLTHHGKKFLVECGLFQGYKELRLRNWESLPVHPSEIEAVILTHAHIDHSGYIPLLVKNGFRGDIYCSEGTYDLCSILLRDSGHLQEEEAQFANRYGYSKHKPALPLYTIHDAEVALKQFKTVPYLKTISLLSDLNFQLIPSGHIIGSTFVNIKQGNTSLLFTGDLGRPHDPIMRAPTIVDQADYLVIESTYGDRLHEKRHPKDRLKEIIDKTVREGGSIIIPAFAVGRAQSVLYYLSLLKKENALPNIPIYLDSPMSINATDILCKHKEDHRLSAKECAELCSVATYVQSSEESKAIDANPMPKIIISASGMATGGRILHHIKAYAPHYKNTILFTGYQAGGTRGDRMMKGEKEIKLLGQIIPVHATVEVLNNTSAHADYEEIMAWLSHFKKMPKKVFITHGEIAASMELKKKIEDAFGWTCIIPRYRQREPISD